MDYHKLGEEITKLLKDPDAMKALHFEKLVRKLGYAKISDEPIEEVVGIDLDQYARENGYVKKTALYDRLMEIGPKKKEGDGTGFAFTEQLAHNEALSLWAEAIKKELKDES